MTKHTIEQTYQTIYRSCFPKLVTYLQRKYACNRQDAEDIAAQALHILWQKWDGLDSHTEAGILCWLFLTVQNLMRNEAKKRRRSPVLISLEKMTDNQHPIALPETSPQQSEEEYDRYLKAIMRMLSERDAALFHAKIVEKESDEVIAARLGLSQNTLRVRWLRVKRRILAMWDDLEKDT